MRNEVSARSKKGGKNMVGYIGIEIKGLGKNTLDIVKAMYANNKEAFGKMGLYSLDDFSGGIDGPLTIFAEESVDRKAIKAYILKHKDEYTNALEQTQV